MIQLFIIAGYFVLLITVGFLSSRLFRGTSQDYMLASHSIGPFLLLMSLFGTTMTAFALVGSTGKAYQTGIGVYGLMASSSAVVHSLCFFLIGIPMWRLGRRHGYTTQIQFFRDRLECNHIGLLLFPILVGLIIPYLLIGVLGGGTVIQKVTVGAFPNSFAEFDGGVPPWLGSLVICMIVLAYVFAGGMRGTAWANAFQTSVFIILGIVTFLMIASRIGGQDSLLANLQAATQNVQQRHPEMLTRDKVPPALFFSFMLVPLSAGMFPHLFQHWLTAINVDSFRLPIIVHPIFIMLVWAPCVLVGIWATSATVGGALLIPEGTNPNAVLALMVARLSGPVLSGLLTAGILAAIMSSLDSQFLCVGTMFTKDIVEHYAGRDRLTDGQIVVIARGFVVAVVAITYVLSLLEPRAVFDLGIWCFSGFSALVPLAVAAIYWKRLTAAGAWASVIATAATWVYFFVQSDFAKNPKYSFYGMLPCVGMIGASAFALILVSFLTQPPSDRSLERFFPPPS
ncbi:MAG: sodium:solute symporter family protein [Fuerstiella sp.]|nr:sodium:solute symporter family protein [Fuerstiella sp.]